MQVDYTGGLFKKRTIQGYVVITRYVTALQENSAP